MANLTLAIKPPPQIPVWMQKGSDPSIETGKGSDPAAGSDPNSALIEQINAALNGKMHRERWKYTKAQPVLDSIALADSANPTDQGWLNLPKGVSHSAHDSNASTAPVALDILQAPEACSAFCYHDAIDVLVVEGTVSEPLILNHQDQRAPMVLKLAANAQLDLRETFADHDAQHQTLWIELGPGSQLTHSRNSFNTGSHWQFLHVTIDRDAHYELHQHTLGTKMRRQDVQIHCAGAGAHAAISSAAYIEPSQHLDQQVTIEHQAPHSTSTQVFHNIAGDKAKVTFNGRIHIHPNANGVDAQLSNKNLGLGNNAVINTKPELEIYTDDVKCSHGATVGQIDENHLFYCASRGIDPDQARNLLSQAFLNECTTGPLADQARDVFHTTAQA